MFAMFGGLLVYLFLSAWNWPMDNITFWVCLWNFSAIGIVSVFLSFLNIEICYKSSFISVNIKYIIK